MNLQDTGVIPSPPPFGSAVESTGNPQQSFGEASNKDPLGDQNDATAIRFDVRRCSFGCRDCLGHPNHFRRRRQPTGDLASCRTGGERDKKPAEEIQGWTVTFKNDELWLVKPTGADPKVKFKLDPSQSPRTIDLIVQEGKDKGRVAPGIYALANGQLRLCINIFGNPSYRPREFKTQDRDGAGFVILERAKTK